jgi:hypothetical protein
MFTIIIQSVSFCSDIWYCNILAYYLDKTTLLYNYNSPHNIMFRFIKYSAVW